MALQKLVDLAKASVTVSDAVPAVTDVGSLWFESDTAQFFIYYDNTWVEVGGSSVESVINSITAKGDLLVGAAASSISKLSVGSNGRYLMADSTQTTGMKWGTAPFVTTSTTRSTDIPSPYVGQAAFETDTGKVLYYYNSGWYPAWNTAWGLITQKTDQTIQSGIGTTETVTLTTSSFTAVANRNYRITYFEPMLQASTTPPGYITARIRITDINGAVYQYADLEPVVSSTSDGQMMTMIAVSTLSAGSTIFVGTLKTSSNTVTAYGGTAAGARRYLMVEDIGPV